MRQTQIYLACALVHFFLLFGASCRDTLSLVARRLTILPAPFSRFARQIEPLASVAAGQNLSHSNPLRRGLLTYLHRAGIDKTYGYFAPNVPPSYKLVFELRHADGRVADELPRVNSAAAGLRFSGLLDEIGRTPHPALREYLIKTLAGAVWREHPDVTAIRAIFGVRNFPTADEFVQGKPESYDFLYAYDFSRQNEDSESPESR